MSCGKCIGVGESKLWLDEQYNLYFVMFTRYKLYKTNTAFGLTLIKYKINGGFYWFGVQTFRKYVSNAAPFQVVKFISSQSPDSG